MKTAFFNGKVALVTGAAAGIGRASAQAFANEGAEVVVADIAVQGGEETVQSIMKNGGKAMFIQTDVTRADAVELLVGQIIKRFGRLDFAHNNAGIEGATSATADCTEESWDRTIAVNLKGVWLCMKHEIPQMLRQRGGVIVNTASVAGLVGVKGFCAYSASKHGIIGLTKTAALDYARHNIRINAVCPGLINTAMLERVVAGQMADDSSEAHSISQKAVEAYASSQQPVKRMGTPEEVAAAVIWLCSDAAAFMTGQTLVMDGGYTAR